MRECNASTSLVLLSSRIMLRCFTKCCAAINANPFPSLTTQKASQQHQLRQHRMLAAWQNARASNKHRACVRRMTSCGKPWPAFPYRSVSCCHAQQARHQLPTTADAAHSVAEHNSLCQASPNAQVLRN
jgi:hypothetical protein